MRKILILTLALFAFINFGCTKKTETKKEKLTTKTIQKFLLGAIDGNQIANDTLYNIIDYSFPINSDYTDLSIDSLHIFRKKLFTILLQYNNPIYNRFAVYNSNLQAELIDKSLNGRIKKEIIKINGKDFIKLKEEFISKDIFNLKRISLYKLDSTSAKLVFRTLVELKERGRKYTQKISDISNERIITKLNSSRRSNIRKKSDVFLYNKKTKKYEPSKNLFYNFVKDRIEKKRGKLKLTSIEDYDSALRSVGIVQTKSKINNTVEKKNTVDKKETNYFNITINKEWKRFDNFSITEHLLKMKKGTKFLNTSIGASLSILKLDQNDNVTDYVKYPFVKGPSDGFNMNSTEKIEYGKYFYQFFEFDNGIDNYIFILKGSKYTYKKFENTYHSILKSFRLVK